MQGQTIIEKELSVLTEALQELKPCINKINRIKIAKSVKESERTVRRYLNGEVARIEVAKKILAACKQNIEDREKELSAIAS